MIILQDSREQHPLSFKSLPAPPKVEVITLATGDYSIKGFERLVCLERKSIADLTNTLVRNVSAKGPEKGRFSRELERMKEYKYAAIIVEGTVRDILNHKYRSLIAPRSILGMLSYIWVGVGVPTFWCDDAEASAEVVYSMFKQIFKRENKLAQESKTDSKGCDSPG